MRPIYPFDEKEFQAANAEWGCNCGPTALAFALQVKLLEVRTAIPLFEERRYTSPTMMREAIANLRRDFVSVPAGLKRAGRNNANAVAAMFHGAMTLARVQWTGPWIVAGKPTRWAARQTHWIACWSERGVPMIFDCNGGIQGFGKWESEILPLLTASVSRADGGWYPANIWRLV